MTEQAWDQKDLERNPHAAEDKPSRVRRMFEAIAPAYDLNNRLHSFWRDQAWRKKAVRLAKIGPEDDVLDVACGTGDLTEALAKAGPKSIVGLDYTPGMLEIAKDKLRKRRNELDISYIEGDATRLECDDESKDVITIAFGIRNVGEPDRAFSEFFRVLRPKGRLIVLEFSEPTFAPARWGSRLWTHHIMPRTATLISGDSSGAYRYLPRSVETFLDAQSLADAMTRAGFSGVQTKSLDFGICALHLGVKT